MAAENKNVTFDDLDENETDPDLIARAATNLLFENATKNAKDFLEKDEEFKKLNEHSKEIVLKLLVNKIINETIGSFRKK